MRVFEYNGLTDYEGKLKLKDIGNCILVGRNKLRSEFFLLIKTTLGWTEIINYGPYNVNFEQVRKLPHNVSYTYTRFEFSEYKIKSAIDKFLNAPNNCIVEAEETTLDEIKPKMIVMVEEMYNERNS